MPERKSSSKVVSQQPAPIVHAPEPDEPPITLSVTINDPKAIAYSIVFGVVSAVLDRVFGGQSHD